MKYIIMRDKPGYKKLAWAEQLQLAQYKSTYLSVSPASWCGRENNVQS